MGSYLLRRLMVLITTILVIATVVFFGIHFAPGDPASITLGLHATDETIAEVRHELGLDRPLIVQYLSFMLGLVRGDLGQSFHSEQPVLQMVATAFVPTLLLVSVSMALALLAGGIIGALAAVYENTPIDALARILAVVGVSVPVFWAALLFIILFSVHLNWLPVAGYGSWQQIVLPAIALSGQTMAFVARLFRSNLIDEKRQDYVRTARSKGIRERRVWWRHILRNSLLSVVTLVGVRMGTLLGGAVIIENIFAWPGLGTLVVTAVSARDYPVVLGGVIWIAVMVTLINVLVDLIYTVVDPKIVYS